MRIIVLAFMLTGCVDAATLCANKLNIPQDSERIYLSGVDEDKRMSYMKCVADEHGDRRIMCASRLGIPQDSNGIYVSSVSEPIRIAYSQCVDNNHSYHCSTQCFGQNCFTNCR